MSEAQFRRHFLNSLLNLKIIALFFNFSYVMIFWGGCTLQQHQETNSMRSICRSKIGFIISPCRMIRKKNSKLYKISFFFSICFVFRGSIWLHFISHILNITKDEEAQQQTFTFLIDFQYYLVESRYVPGTPKNYIPRSPKLGLFVFYIQCIFPAAFRLFLPM